ncbi:MAG TPA: aldose 1-epimerase family protein [Steroidobacteraceae bacterium]|jgi:galactose mutarotase-like enzyme|nr:aldose 1-epimerase family protein [Steroidobacteraceae bacterium]
MSDDRAWLTLASGSLTAQVDPLGAQLSILRDASGRDLLWDGNPAFWTGRSPLLFPIVGALAGGRYRIGEKVYALPRHGFARGRQFEIVSTSPSEAILRLKADDQTLLVYPFQFELQVRYEIADTTLQVTTSVINRGDLPMPASFGYHPAFRWPLPFGRPRAAHTIEFDLDEPAPIRRLNSAGLVKPEAYPTPIHARRLVIEDELFLDDAVILDAVRSQAVSYGASSGPRLALRFPDTPYLGLWSKPGAPFICIEPWHGLADPVGFSGELAEKPGIFSVQPGAQHDMRMQATLTGG